MSKPVPSALPRACPEWMREHPEEDYAEPGAADQGSPERTAWVQLFTTLSTQPEGVRVQETAHLLKPETEHFLEGIRVGRMEGARRGQLEAYNRGLDEGMQIGLAVGVLGGIFLGIIIARSRG